MVFAGIDEAGRGPLAGCVTAGCVIMPRTPVIPSIDDSKKISEVNRERLFEEIIKHAVFIGVGRVSAEEIDQINILQATKLAMRRAAQGAPTMLYLIDAVSGIGLKGEERPIIHGDTISYAIAAASIVAKVSRDRELRELDQKYPGYGFLRNKGYGTAEHMEAIRALGPCPEHRRTFITRIHVS